MSIHTLSGAYAVHALGPAEEAAFEAHIATCPDCATEVAELRAAAASLTATESVAPPAALRNRVLAEIRTVRPLPPLTESPATQAASASASATPDRPDNIIPFGRRVRSRVTAGLVAAAVLIGGGVTVATHPWDRGTHAVVSLADQVLRAPDAKRTTVDVGSARLTVVRSEAVGRAVVQAQGVAPAPSGKVYELWLQSPSQQMVKAGFMAGGTDQTVLLDGNARSAIGMGVTVEPAGGSDQPTSQPIALVDLQRLT